MLITCMLLKLRSIQKLFFCLFLFLFFVFCFFFVCFFASSLANKAIIVDFFFKIHVSSLKVFDRSIHSNRRSFYLGKSKQFHYWFKLEGDISEFAICHVLQHGSISGRRIKYSFIIGLVTVEGF